MQVAIFGGTGFIGCYVVEALRAAGHEIALLARDSSNVPDSCRVVEGDIADRAAIAATLRDADAVMYLIGILRESRRDGITFEELQFNGVARVADAAKQAGIKRFLLMSAHGVEARSTPYQTTKHDAERLLADEGFELTVIRPSVVFGDPRGKMEFATQLWRDMVRPPIPAVAFFSGWHPARGAVRMSPVHVRDVAAAFCAALERPEAIGACYALGGPEDLSWPEMLRRIGEATERRKLILPMPIGLMYVAATLLDWLPVFPVTRDQLKMLAQGNVVDSAELRRLIGSEPQAFSAANLDYLGDTTRNKPTQR